MRFHLAALVFDRRCDWNSLNAVIPDAYSTPDEKLVHAPRPRIIKSHQGYDDRYPKVIYLVRDVRDVVVSYYYHQKGRGHFPQHHGFNTFFDWFVSDAVWPGGWDHHVVGWLNNRARIPNGFLLVRYEDLLHDIRGQTKRILEFLHIERTDQDIRAASRWSSFEHVREMERKAVQRKIPFVRNGKAGQWSEVLSDDQKRRANRKYGELLAELGYPV
jgi:hypothetical protein